MLALPRVLCADSWRAFIEAVFSALVFALASERPPVGHFLWVSGWLIRELHERLFLARLEIVWILAHGEHKAHWQGVGSLSTVSSQGRPGLGCRDVQTLPRVGGWFPSQSLIKSMGTSVGY